MRQQRERAFADERSALEQLHERVRRKVSSVDVSRARALGRLADERAGRVQPGPRPLSRTA